MNLTLKKQTQNSPRTPGVYLFKNKAGEILYIGKAANLRSRLKQYLRKEARSPFLEHVLNKAEKIETKTTESEIEAFILESKLIKERQPKYNIMLRDDKQYFYVVFTKEEFPRIFLTHQPYKIAVKKSKTQITNFKSNLNVLKFKIKNLNLLTLDAEYIGPFTDGNALKSTLRLLRKVFPYCTCKQKHHNFCLNYHIGKCLGFCCLKQQNPNNSQLTINKRLYLKNINAVKDILSGKRDFLIKKLRKELGALGKKQEFEKAIELRNKIGKLEKIFANAKIINRDANIRHANSALRMRPSELKNIHTNDTNVLIELKKLLRLPKIPRRIEGYDISNIQGENATGSMAVFTDGQPDKNEYRKFKIRRKNEPDDIAMLKEVLTRRLRHPEWPFPNLIFIDGGKGQLNAAKEAIAKFPAFTPPTPSASGGPSKTSAGPAIISLAKGKQEIFSTTLKKPVPMKKLQTEVQNLIRGVDSEAHRFAIYYYRKIHRRALLKTKRPE